MSHEHISQSISVVHPITLSHGKNAEVWDTTGKRYIDFVGGIGVLNLGHCHPNIVAAIQEQATRLTHYAFNAAGHQPYIDVMNRLADFVPLSYPLSGMLTNSGAEAAENALKIARGATGKTAIIAFDGGFHGRTLSTLNLNGKFTGSEYGDFLNTERVPSNFTLNGSASYQLPNYGVLRDNTIALNALNLLNRRYLALPASPTISAAESSPTCYVGAPRQWYITISTTLF